MKYKNNRRLKSVNQKITIRELCSFAEVSESGYYKWLATSDLRQERLRCEMSDY